MLLRDERAFVQACSFDTHERIRLAFVRRHHAAVFVHTCTFIRVRVCVVVDMYAATECACASICVVHSYTQWKMYTPPRHLVCLLKHIHINVREQAPSHLPRHGRRLYTHEGAHRLCCSARRRTHCRSASRSERQAVSVLQAACWFEAWIGFTGMSV